MVVVDRERQMVAGVKDLTVRMRVADVLEQYLVPLGWLVILISMFIAGDRGRVHQLFYIFLLLPTVSLLVLRPGLLKPLVCHPFFACFAVFSAYMLLTVAWSTTDQTALSLLRRPLYLAALLFCAAIVGMSSLDKLNSLTRIGALVAVVAAALSLAYFLKVSHPAGEPRLNGYGALYNALLSAHVFGAFATYWLATWMHGRSLLKPLPLVCLAILVATLLATGSRTPLVGMAAAFAWLLVTGDKRRGLVMVGVIVVGAIALFAMYPEAYTQRGMSYRPQIWMNAWQQISHHPWFGHGYDANMLVLIPGLDQILADPHNMELGVLYAGGTVGLVLWVAMYAVALTFCWRNRAVPAVNLATAWLIFGIGSGLTEGMAFMSRPKEHWYLIWMPLAFIYGQWVAQRSAKAWQALRRHDSPDATQGLAVPPT